ncbi:hypothetical protein V1515DRAFT_605936 [Lipomyces mesembrius]
MQANISGAFRNAQQTPDYKRRCLSSVATRDLVLAVIEQLYELYFSLGLMIL